jgi:gliding motility-associated-like protein
MTNRTTSLFLIFFALASELSAQPQDYNWYFGRNAGITFRYGNPIPVFDGALTTEEGVSSVSDKDGNLLFYTNGNKIYNRDHQLMSNGTGLTGHASSSQSSLIVQFPDDADMYYLFTVPAQLGSIGGSVNPYLCYSVINMKMENGLGNVVLKNLQLQNSVCEKITATRHANKKDVWVTVHSWGSNAYYSYPVTCNGIGLPVVSYAGASMSLDAAGGNNTSIGCMKFSRDGKKIAAAWAYSNSPIDADSYLQIADFDNATGYVSNPLLIVHHRSDLVEKGYGVEFSPSSNLLYFSENGSRNGGPYGKVFQYDMMVNNIGVSEVLLAHGINAFGTLQRGPDDKIYIARYNGAQFISVIERPDVPGPGCNLVNNAVSLAPSISTWGLPNNWDTYPEMETQLADLIPYTDTVVCNSTGSIHITASLPASLYNASISWSSGSVDSFITIDQSGLYTVQVLSGCDTITDSVTVTFTEAEFDLGNDTTFCYGEGLMINGPETFSNYLWQDGSSQNSYLASGSGLYILTVTGNNGCAFTDSISVTRETCGCGVYVPTAFTPDNDGRNELLMVYSNCSFSFFRFAVYNRWGQTVFMSDDPGSGWSGAFNSIASGQNVYSWTLEYASPETGKGHKTMMGNVLLLR